MGKEDGKVGFKVDGVNARDRYVFRRAMAATDKPSGEVVSELLREYAERTFGPGSVAYMIEKFENRQSNSPSEDKDTAHHAPPMTPEPGQ